MTIVNVHEAKTHLSRLLERVEAGEEIVIARAGKPIARLLAIQPVPAIRPLGLWRGKVWIAPDVEDDLPSEVLAAFNGEES